MELHESENSNVESINPFITVDISEDFQDYFPINDRNDYDPLNFDNNEYDDIVSFFNRIFNENNRQSNRHIFKKRGKRGKKRTKRSKNHEHISSDFDNIITKIQIHFLTFLICFLNDAVSTLVKNKQIKFLNFSHEIKSKVTKNHIDTLKNFKILDLLTKLKISSKYKRYTKDNNIMNAYKLNEYPWFKRFFQMKYLDLFFYYYNHELPLTKLLIFEDEIVFSSKTKSFYYLLEKNKNLKEDMVKYAQLIYYVDKNEYGSP